MAFSLRNLSVLAYANGFTLWLYQAGCDSRAVIVGTDFFEDAGDMMAKGDMVMVSARDGGQMLCVSSDDSGLRVLPLN